MALLRPKIARPVSATDLLAVTYTQAEPVKNWYKNPQALFPTESKWDTITMIENARPWSRPDTTWANHTASQGSLSSLRRTATAKYELAMPEHYPSFSRRSRGPPVYNHRMPTMSTDQLIEHCSRNSLNGSSSRTSLSGSASLGSLSRTPSQRSLRLEELRQSRSGRPRTSESRPTILERPTSAASPNPEGWRDPMKGGLGYGTKFYYLK